MNRVRIGVAGTLVLGLIMGTFASLSASASVTVGTGQLKICKLAGTPAPTGTWFNFDVSGVSGVTSVPVGGCNVVGGALTGVRFPVGTVVTIVEVPTTGDVVSAITVVPTYVTNCGKLTSQLVLTGPPILPLGTVTVVIGDSTTTEVTYTNTEAPAPIPTPAPPVIAPPAPTPAPAVVVPAPVTVVVVPTPVVVIPPAVVKVPAKKHHKRKPAPKHIPPAKKSPIIHHPVKVTG